MLIQPCWTIGGRCPMLDRHKREDVYVAIATLLAGCALLLVFLVLLAVAIGKEVL